MMASNIIARPAARGLFFAILVGMGSDTAPTNAARLGSENCEPQINDATVKRGLVAKITSRNRSGIGFTKKTKSDQDTKPKKVYGIQLSSEITGHYCSICGSRVEHAWRVTTIDQLDRPGFSVRIARRGGYAFSRDTS